jgi:hypothetical protein
VSGAVGVITRREPTHHRCRNALAALVLRQTFSYSVAMAHARQSPPSSESAAVKSQRPIAADDEHRVLQFRPRNPAHSLGLKADVPAPTHHESTAPEPLDMSRYEREREEPDDFRHRMLANIAAFAFTVALTAIGIWLAMSIADLRKTQDCLMMGRRDCARITTQQY